MKVETAEYVHSAFRNGDFVTDGRPEVAFVGRSNVGKSSLLNRLLGRKGLARVSSTPGRTRAVHYFQVNRRFHFVDLPGYGYAKAGKEDRREWAALVGSYLERPGAEERAVVLLVDSKVGATPLDEQAYGYLRGLGVPVVVVATKIDRVPKTKRHAAVAAIARTLALPPESEVVPVSSETGEGIQGLWGALGPHLGARAR